MSQICCALLSSFYSHILPLLVHSTRVFWTEMGTRVTDIKLKSAKVRAILKLKRANVRAIL